MGENEAPPQAGEEGHQLGEPAELNRNLHGPGKEWIPQQGQLARKDALMASERESDLGRVHLAAQKQGVGEPCWDSFVTALISASMPEP